MIKICSLDFLNKKKFDVDILAETGEVLIPSGQKITPELLLRLYFKNIYTEKEPEEEVIKESEEQAIKEPEVLSDLILDETNLNIEEKAEEDIKEIQLEFDEQKAEQISQLALKVGKKLNFSEKNLEELKRSTFYSRAAINKFTTKDLLDKNFKTRLAEATYKFLIEDLKFSEKEAEVAKFHIKKYVSKEFIIKDKDASDMPYYHIVAIVNYWDELLSKNYTKEQALTKMLKLGGNQFNIFALHKFINIMKEER